MRRTEPTPSLWRKLFALMLALCVCFTAMGTGVMAAEDDYYDEDYDDEDYDDEDYDDEDGQTEWDGTEGIVLSEEELLLPVGESEELFVCYDNEDLDDYEGSVKWTVEPDEDNPGLVTIKNGKVTAKKAGDVSVTATVTIDGEEYEAYCDIVVADVKLANSKLTLVEGQTVVLKIKNRWPEDDKVDEWDIVKGEKFVKLSKETNKSVAITAQKKGTAKVGVSMDSGAEAFCTITVKAATATTSLSFKKKSLEMAKGSKVKLSVTRAPKNANDAITWSSSRKKVATVDAKGEVTAKGKGTTVITAKAGKGKKAKKATCTITVKAPEKLALKNSSATLKVGKSTAVQVKSGSKKGLSYKSSNPKVAVVSKKGKVTALKPGAAKITVTAKNGAKAIFTVKVKK